MQNAMGAVRVVVPLTIHCDHLIDLKPMWRRLIDRLLLSMILAVTEHGVASLHVSKNLRDMQAKTGFRIEANLSKASRTYIEKPRGHILGNSRHPQPRGLWTIPNLYICYSL
uniref:(northern house mosquito) hypothetical protein n=1 Tax=Culex pipiens TaxID=7175 RepID=A0A8D8HDX5_CULPI